MATSASGRTGSRSRSSTGKSSFFGGRTQSMGIGRMGSSGRSGTTNRSKSGSRTTRSTPAGYKSCNTTFAKKIQSFKTLFQQTTGPARCGRPSPTTLNSFAKWINKGAIVQTVTAAQVSRWARSTKKTFNSRSASPTACKNVLCAKFGKSTIKAVARSKTGSFLVATAPTVSGRTFAFPKG